MAGDHLSARQRNGEWWAQHSLYFRGDRSDLHPDTTGPSTYSSSEVGKIWLPRAGPSGMPLVDRCARLYTPAGQPDNIGKGVTLECVYWTTVTGFNFFGGVWVRSIASVRGWYAYGLSLELHPFNDNMGDTEGRAVAAVGDIGGVWPSQRLFYQPLRINDGQPHHLLAVWPPGSRQVSLYVDGALSEVREYEREQAHLAPDEVWASVDQYFTHCDGWVSHVAVGPALTTRGEIIARAGLTPSFYRQNVAAEFPGHRGTLPDEGRVMGWDATNHQWCPVRIEKVGRDSRDTGVSGGTITDFTDSQGYKWRMHRFDSSGTLTVTNPINMDILIVGGGAQGGGARGLDGARTAGGGGAGALRTWRSAYFTAANHAITVAKPVWTFTMEGADGEYSGIGDYHTTGLYSSGGGGGALHENGHDGGCGGGTGGSRSWIGGGAGSFGGRGGRSGAQSFGAGGGGGMAQDGGYTEGWSVGARGGDGINVSADDWSGVGWVCAGGGGAGWYGDAGGLGGAGGGGNAGGPQHHDGHAGFTPGSGGGGAYSPDGTDWRLGGQGAGGLVVVKYRIT